PEPYPPARQPAAPETSPTTEAACAHPCGSDVLQLGPLIFGHHLFQIDQNEQLVVLVADALDELGRFVGTDIRCSLDFRLTQIDHFGHAIDQDTDHLSISLD